MEDEHIAKKIMGFSFFGRERKHREEIERQAFQDELDKEIYENGVKEYHERKKHPQHPMGPTTDMSPHFPKVGIGNTGKTFLSMPKVNGFSSSHESPSVSMSSRDLFADSNKKVKVKDGISISMPTIQGFNVGNSRNDNFDFKPSIGDIHWGNAKKKKVKKVKKEKIDKISSKRVLLDEDEIRRQIEKERRLKHFKEAPEKIEKFLMEKEAPKSYKGEKLMEAEIRKRQEINLAKIQSKQKPPRGGLKKGEADLPLRPLTTYEREQLKARNVGLKLERKEQKARINYLKQEVEEAKQEDDKERLKELKNQLRKEKISYIGNTVQYVTGEVREQFPKGAGIKLKEKKAKSIKESAGYLFNPNADKFKKQRAQLTGKQTLISQRGSAMQEGPDGIVIGGFTGGTMMPIHPQAQNTNIKRGPIGIRVNAPTTSKGSLLGTMPRLGGFDLGMGSKKKKQI